MKELKTFDPKTVRENKVDDVTKWPKSFSKSSLTFAYCMYPSFLSSFKSKIKSKSNQTLYILLHDLQVVINLIYIR